MFVDVVMLLIAQKLAEQPCVMDPRLFARALRGMRKGSSGCEHIELSHWPEVFRYMPEVDVKVRFWWIRRGLRILSPGAGQRGIT